MKNFKALQWKLEALEGFKVVHRIYILISEIDNSVFYVGLTEFPLSVRLSHHIKDHTQIIKYRNNPHYQQLFKTARIELIETIVSENIIDLLKVEQRESKWIRHYSKKFDLLNTQYNKNAKSKMSTLPKAV